MKKSFNTSLLFIILACTLQNHHAIQASTSSSSSAAHQNARDLQTPENLITRANDNSVAQIISNGIKRSFSSVSDSPTEIHTTPIAIKVRRLLDEIEQDENDLDEELQEKIHKRIKIIENHEEALRKETAQQELLVRQQIILNNLKRSSLPKNSLLNMR